MLKKSQNMKKIFVLIGFTFLAYVGFPQNNLVGKKAPKIEVEKWIYPKIKLSEWEVKEIPEEFEGKIVVLDFWFTRCAPCVASIPELNFLAKNYPEIVFLSITFEKEEPIDEFLKKMVMYYPVGSDPDKKTINAYGVLSYPETFLIDEQGVVQWQGSPFELNNEILTRATGLSRKEKSISIPAQEVTQLNAAYSFTIQRHNLEMGESSYFHYNPFEINVLNRSLKNILNVFYGINSPRIINRKGIALEESFDLTLKADQSITTEANCVEMLRFLLPNELGIQINEHEVDTIVKLVKITNSPLLEKNISKTPYFETTLRYENWEAKGASLVDLKNFLESQYEVLVEVNMECSNKYSFILPVNDIQVAVGKLESDYGITLVDRRMVTKFWVLE